MPYQIVWRDKGIYIQQTGMATDEAGINIVKECLQDYRFEEIRYALIDMTACEGISLSSSFSYDSAVLSYKASMINNDIKVALVTDMPEILAFIEEYEKVDLPKHPIRIFGNLEDARKWCSDTKGTT